jgi:transcriptional regulator with XRE-family HTH domain
MIVKKLRLQKCWSQEQLSQFSGLSVRTIQRIERGQQPSLESLKSIAAVFQININDLQPEKDMTNHNTDSNKKATQLDIEEKKAMEYVEGIKGFYQNLFTYFIVIGCLTAINLFVSPEYLWVFWCAGGWGIGIILHGIQVFEIFSLFSPEWEKKAIEKRLGREL